MKRNTVWAGVCLVFAAAGGVYAADTADLEAQLRQVVERNLAAYSSENVAGVLAEVHTKSPGYAVMRDALPQQFDALDTRTQLDRFYYIGHDDEFAVARVQYRTVGGSGQAFLNNVLDTIAIFHQEDGAWKYWDEHVLGVRLVE